MRITTKGHEATIRRTVLVSNGPVLNQPYSSSGKQFRVDRIVVDYQCTEGTRWVVRSSSCVILGGFVLKKDGTDSKVRHSGGIDYHVWQNRQIHAPWLVEIIDQLRPHGASVLFHGEIEI